MASEGEPWGAWQHAGRVRPESALEFCENMIACLELVRQADRDEYWRHSMDGYLAKREELLVQFPKAAAPPARELDLFEAMGA